MRGVELFAGAGGLALGMSNEILRRFLEEMTAVS